MVFGSTAGNAQEADKKAGSLNMSAWDACTMEPNSAFRWIECHPAFMAATQDVLLILTILVAIGVPAYAEYLRRKEKRDASQAYAASLFAPLTRASFDIPRVRRAIAAFKHEPALSPNLPGILDSINVRIPSELDYAMPRLHQFDNEFVRSIRSSIMALQSYNIVLMQAQDAAIDAPEQFDATRGKIVALVEATLEQVQDQLKRTLGLPKPGEKLAAAKETPP